MLRTNSPRLTTAFGHKIPRFALSYYFQQSTPSEGAYLQIASIAKLAEVCVRFSESSENESTESLAMSRAVGRS